MKQTKIHTVEEWMDDFCVKSGLSKDDAIEKIKEFEGKMKNMKLGKRIQKLGAEINESGCGTEMENVTKIVDYLEFLIKHYKNEK